MLWKPGVTYDGPFNQGIGRFLQVSVIVRSGVEEMGNGRHLRSQAPVKALERASTQRVSGVVAGRNLYSDAVYHADGSHFRQKND